MCKRLYDITFAGLGLLVLAPVLFFIAVLVRLKDGSPVLFRQARVGQGGQPFTILKFRTMVPNAPKLGGSVTKAGDSRVTTLGIFLRRLKLDELPQLWNVLAGDMSFVGPRPEVPFYVEKYTPEQRAVLHLKPGITDLATLLYRNEEEILSSAEDLHGTYLRELMPHKISLNLLYAQYADWWEDTKVIIRTLLPGVPLKLKAEHAGNGMQLTPKNRRLMSHRNKVAAGSAPRHAPDLAGPMPTKARLARVLKFLLFYSTALASSIWLAYGLRYDFSIPADQMEYIPSVMAAVIPIELLALYAFHQFHLLPAYFGIPALLRMCKALAVATLLLAFARWKFELGYALPFGVICLNFVLSLGILSLMCYTWRLYRHGYLLPLLGLSSLRSRRKPVAIIGAGPAGMAVAQEFLNYPERGYTVAAFFDDDETKWNSRILEIPVLGPPEMLDRSLAHSFEISEVVICRPEATRQRIREIIKYMGSLAIPVKTVPSLIELASGSYTVSNVRNVEIQDLLGRDPVELDTNDIRHLIRGKRVMVTGAGGSIGSELCRQVAANGPSELMLVERSEVQLFAIEQELAARGQASIVQPLVADILDQKRMRQIFTDSAPEIIFHAAAHKHVPMMESQPCEAIRNNVFGTERMARFAVEFGVQHFVNISTDKAINPTSVMGCTKRLAEMVVLDIQARNPNKTRFVCVRFGNVLGSSGSVVPLFKRQIAAGGPITVTHAEMKRYFMTIPEAVGLVLQTTVLAEGGEIFVLDMGEPVKIVDLARQMITLSGYEPGSDIKIEFTGIRPGEKMFEEISYSSETVDRTRHPKVMRLRSKALQSAALHRALNSLEDALGQAPAEQLRLLLSEAVPEYRIHPGGLPRRQSEPQSSRPLVSADHSVSV